MIQVFQNSYKSFSTNKMKCNFIVSAIFIYIYLLLVLNLNDEKTSKNIISNIFTFSGVFLAILMTFIISKIFQIRNEKREVRFKVIRLSNKLTDYRRICDKILLSDKVWNSNTRSKMKNEYKYLTYRNLYDDYQKNKPKNLIKKFREETNIPGASFYLALRELVNENYEKWELELFSEYDGDIIYPLEIVQIWWGIGCFNAFFYYLEDKYGLYKNDILINNIGCDKKKEIERLANKINNERYGNKKFDKELLVDLGNYFQTELIPRLLNYLSEFNEGFSKSLNYIYRMLILIMIFGVFIPLIFPFVENLFVKEMAIVHICTLMMSLIFINFIIDFKKILMSEINIK
ncbi:hypothetical protein [Riemerella anatipestifer]|uniref:Uncharacterized protein n=1 Tax=Riemerella anatipestifer TaxID=34085 RepID=A0AAP6HF22_RIEAN|nr:hypothetical protein [Riemerella anatipestifer]MBT0548501.1 hypothetical protein [Riemerella anatipestifer]MBT0555611.1 hypothetical protein [Riemerella anatipestifer]MBT0559264.1 hypothetical protein [Riemerella anatipestifer]MCO7355189.1 hypothetical protein [Riemerella anatipestifer]MCU7540434.1 hypothetical protein [Riemerella anatipestifer]